MGTPASVKSQIIFFDGICNLCNGTVDFIIKRDKKNSFRFASLQSEIAESYLPDPMLSSLSSIVLYADGKLYTESDAAIYIAAQLGGIWSIFKIFFIVPKFLRDGIYRLISKNRYKWFGKRNTCRLPTAEESLRFLEGVQKA